MKIANVTEPAFFTELNRLITGEPLDTWKTYLRWQLANARSPYLSKAYVDANFDFYRRTLRGVSEDRPRWKKCVQWVDRDLGEALGQVFVARTFSPETKAKAVEMTRLVEQAMAEEIRELPWMSAETKTRALQKLATIVNKVGYPDAWRDYSALAVARGDFAGNVSRATAFESRRQLAKIGKPVDRGEWGMTPPTVNAYYNPQMNDINFPAGVLQPPLYDPKLDDAPNYGNTGIDHRPRAHARLRRRGPAVRRRRQPQGLVDEGGRRGLRRARCSACRTSTRSTWWWTTSRSTASSRSGEDVADLGGTLLAYLAWKRATAAAKLAPVDGLSPDQRFFVGFAQWACENDRPENLRVSAATDPHSPGRYRINGIVSNLAEFRQAFACKAGQPMVREVKCKIW